MVNQSHIRILPDPKSKETSTPFAGCKQLLSHYATIGSELIAYQGRRQRYGFGAVSAFREFHEGVVFVPTEVLESYLGDLLDSDSTDEYLFITGDRIHWTPLFITAVGLGAALGSGLYAAASGMPLHLAFGLTVISSLPFAWFWYTNPRSGAMRRMMFARVVSQEIAGRRGFEQGDFGSTGILLPEIFSHARSRTMAGAARTTIQRADLPVRQ